MSKRNIVLIIIIIIEIIFLVLLKIESYIASKDYGRVSYCSQAFGCTNDCALDDGKCMETCYYCASDDEESCTNTVKCTPSR